MTRSIEYRAPDGGPGPKTPRGWYVNSFGHGRSVDLAGPFPTEREAIEAERKLRTTNLLKARRAG